MIAGIFLMVGWLISLLGAYGFGIESQHEDIRYEDKFALFLVLIGFIISFISIYNM